MATVKIYVSGWIEYEVANPEALIDASRFTPSELDPSGTAGLSDAPDAVWSDVSHALLVEVSKRAAQYPAPPPPGIARIENNLTYGLAPPTAVQ